MKKSIVFSRAVGSIKSKIVCKKTPEVDSHRYRVLSECEPLNSQIKDYVCD